jgi:hypothetical protein
LGRLNRGWKKVKRGVTLISIMGISDKNNLSKGDFNEFLDLKDNTVRISKCVILKDGKFNIIWDSISHITYCFSFILIPIVISSNIQFLETVRIPEIIIDFILAIDI